MHLGTRLIEASDAMMVAPQSSDRARVFLMCFLVEFTDYDLLMDLGEGTDDVTPHVAYVDEKHMVSVGCILDIVPHMPHFAFNLFGVSAFETDSAILHDAYIDEMDMIGTGRILDVALHRPRSAFDMFRVFMLKMDDDYFVTDVSHNAISVEGFPDSMDPLFPLTLCPSLSPVMMACLLNTIMIRAFSSTHLCHYIFL